MFCVLIVPDAYDIWRKAPYHGPLFSFVPNNDTGNIFQRRNHLHSFAFGKVRGSPLLLFRFEIGRNHNCYGTVLHRSIEKRKMPWVEQVKSAKD